MEQSSLTPEDQQHLSALVILHYIYAGLMVLPFFCCTGWGILTLSAVPTLPPPESPPPGTDPAAYKAGYNIGIFIATSFPCCMAVFIIALAFASFLAGKRLSQHRKAGYCNVISCINCLNIPLGTALGIFTLMVLSRPTVKAVFAANDQRE